MRFVARQKSDYLMGRFTSQLPCVIELALYGDCIGELMVKLLAGVVGFSVAAVVAAGGLGLHFRSTYWPHKPTAMVLASNESDSLDGLNGVDPIAPALRDLGYDVYSIDLPCHGDGISNGGLVCWNDEITSGRIDLLAGFCETISKRIDEIGAQRVQYVGVSRGGYMAFECAALDPRVTDIAQIAPVVGLSHLFEFADNPFASSLTLDRYARNLAERNTLIRIGANDERVGTESVVSYGRLVGSEIHLLNSEGHRAPDPENIMARWLADKWRWPF